jgi:hypothetical protein
MDYRELQRRTASLSDQEFETLVAQARTVRQALSEGAAYERQMHIATGGISARWAERKSPEARTRELIGAYVSAGMTAGQIAERLRELRGRY